MTKQQEEIKEQILMFLDKVDKAFADGRNVELHTHQGSHRHRKKDGYDVVEPTGSAVLTIIID